MADSVSPSPHQLRALAHPARLRMLGLLRAHGPQTASTLAQQLGLNTGATSYHLRQLAQHGFIEDDPSRGNGRERWWRAKHTSTTVDAEEVSTPEEKDQVEAYLQTVVTIYQQQLQRAVEERPLLPAPWRRASTFSDFHHRLTPEHAEQLTAKLEEWLSGLPEDDDPSAARFVVQISAFPYPGSVPPRDDLPEDD